MSRWLLSLFACFALASVVTAQPDDTAGLPGSPLLPSETRADPAPVEDENVTTGKAILRYLASLVDEGKVEAGAWYSVAGVGPGYMARITTRKWTAAINHAVESGEPKQHLFEFEDVIGERVILEVRRRGETHAGLESSDTDVAAGVRLPEAPVELDLRLEGKIWKDETADAAVSRYRAVLESGTDPGKQTFVRFRLGLENAQVNGDSALRGVAGVRLEVGNTPSTPGDIEVRFYADLEVSVGAFIGAGSGGPEGSRSYTGMAGVLLRNDRAGISAEHAYTREESSGRSLTRNVTRVHGYVGLDANNVWQLYGDFGLESVDNSFDPLAPLPPSVLRPRGGFGISVAPWAKRFGASRGPTLNLGTEVREDLDGRVDNRVMGTITIPW